jgi:hypothetical protein
MKTTMNFEFPDFPFSQCVIPEVRLLDGELFWTPGGTKLIAGFDRLLFDFAALEGEKGVLQFAQKYGPLYLCEKHNWPVMHQANRVPCPPRFRMQGGELVLSEPAKAYLEGSRRVRELLKVAEKANSGKPITAIALAQAGLMHRGTIDAPTSAGTPAPEVFVGFESKHLVMGLVNVWLKQGDPRPHLALRRDGRFELQFVSGDQSYNASSLPKQLEAAIPQFLTSGLLFAALAMQIASHVSGGMGLTVCDGCGGFYVPKRTPIQGRKHFCSRCGKSTAQRLWKREHGGRK